MSEEFRQNVGEFTASSEYNALHFVITSIIKGLVNTAIPVRVDKIERPAAGGGAGYLSATPLVKMRSFGGFDCGTAPRRSSSIRSRATLALPSLLSRT